MVLLEGPTGWRFLLSKVTLYYTCEGSSLASCSRKAFEVGCVAGAGVRIGERKVKGYLAQKTLSPPLGPP